MGRRKKGNGIDPRNRKSLQVQMDLGKARERELADYYSETKKSGEWKTDFVNAMRLFLSLRNDSIKVLAGMYPELGKAWEIYNAIKTGNFSAFKEIFPDLYNAIRFEVLNEVSEQSNKEDFNNLLQEVRAIQQKLDGLKSTQTIGLPQGNAGIKQIGATPIAAPNFDDDDDLVFPAKKDEKAGLRAGENLIRSLMSLQK